jgi:diacylglycerol kinase (ATP)
MELLVFLKSSNIDNRINRHRKITISQLNSNTAKHFFSLGSLHLATKTFAFLLHTVYFGGIIEILLQTGRQHRKVPDMQIIENKDIFFIINPNSGIKKTRKFIKELNKSDKSISFAITNNLDELAATFKENSEKYKVFVFVGGDGTVNEAVKYLYGKKNKLLGVFPAGSGNGFAIELGFKKSVDSLIKDINKGESMDIDVLSVNDEKCINMAGLGFDSFVAHCFSQSKSRGLKNYIVSTVKSIFIFKPFCATVTIDKTIIEDKFQMITIANTRQFGNNAIIAPQAKPNDEIFEVVLIKPFPFYMYPVFVVKLFLGSLKDSKYIKFVEAKENVEIKSDFKKYHIDGEPKIFEDSLCIKMLQSKIHIIKTAHNRLT